ncbi:helix-turn-helix transcriptional regulator [Spirochaetes bacterium]|uniref:Helix-turn-helix transcriptional regulator n=1 Tax=Candidatus Scatousia excrementipullorum TaxID=2840936 RepID=A0A9D9GZX6_9BACT|nr:helix-turn-helix transcriptional regulator [Candidatus Scatousia excrementipullorum]
MSKKLLGKRFREIRKKLGYTQEKFAEIAGIEPQSISKIESGKNYPLLANLEKIANNLNIELSDFFIYSHQNNDDELKKVLNETFDGLSNEDKARAVRILQVLKL